MEKLQTHFGVTDPYVEFMLTRLQIDMLGWRRGGGEGRGSKRDLNSEASVSE